MTLTAPALEAFLVPMATLVGEILEVGPNRPSTALTSTGSDVTEDGQR